MRSLARLALVALATVLAGQGCGDDDPGGDAGQSADAAADAAAPARDAAPPADAGDASAPATDCDGAIPAFDEVAIFDKCTVCHGSAVTGDDRHEAPPDVNFDDHASAAMWAERAALYVFHGIMPPRNAGIDVTEAEKQQLYRWASCGTPE